MILPRGADMWTFQRISILFVMTLSILSCSDVEKPSPIEPPTFIDPLKDLPDEGDINFEDLKVGQRSRFVQFEMTYSYETKETNVTYLTDTLVVAITEKNEDHWIVKEFLTQNSISRTDKSSGWGTMIDSIFQSNLSLEGDSIHFYRNPEDWFVTFAFHQEQKFPLSLISDEGPENNSGLPLFSISNASRWTEYLKNYNHYDIVFPRLNIYFNYKEVAFDGWGYTYVYGPSNGLIRVAWVSAWTTNEADGWDFIPRE